MSRYGTGGSANIKVKIHDKEECQWQGWDPGQVEGLQMQMKVKIHFVINSPCELCYLIWCWTWPKSYSPGQCIVPGLSQGVQGTLSMYQVTFHSSRCTRSGSKSPGHSYMYQVTLHIAQDAPGLNKQPRAQFKLHQVKVKQPKANGPSYFSTL